MIYVDFPDGVRYRHKTVAKIVVFGRFYSKNKGKSTYTVARKIRGLKGVSVRVVVLMFASRLR